MNLELDEKERLPRGCLKLNCKVYPVYEGLNTVGRNPEAVINIKNLNISHHHAVITVVDENTHFISDFKSSNGTIVDNEKLSPLKLYKLNNGACVKFADIHCTYRRLDGDEKILDISKTSQNFSESFYSTNTQTMNSTNSDELNLNEMPTAMPRAQTALNETATVPRKPLTINEMPTQIYNCDDSKNSSVEMRDDTSNDSIDFMTMQRTSDSQTFALKSKENFEDKAAVSSRHQSVVDPVRMDSTRNISSSDSEGARSEMKLPNQVTETGDDEEQPSSQICPVRIGSKKAIESDSETEEYIPHLEKRRTKYIISDDDSVTDIEDDADAILNETDIISTTQEVTHESDSADVTRHERSSMGSFRLELSEVMGEKNTDKEAKSEESNVVAKDHIYCREESSDVTQTQKKNEAFEDHIYCLSPKAEKSVEAAEKSKVEVKSKFCEEGSTVSTIVEKILEDDETTPNGEKEVSQNLEEVVEGKTVENDIPNRPTQQVNLEDETQSLDKEDSEDSNEVTEDLIFENRITKEKKKAEVNKMVENNSSFGNEKQILENDKKSKMTNDKIENQEERENKETDNDMFARPQIDLNFDKKKLSSEYKSDDDVFLQPTQRMIGGSDKDEIDDDIYIQPTQRINEDNDEKAKPSEKPDQDFQSAQRLTESDNNLEKDKFDDVEKSEKVAKDHEFARPFQRFDKASKSEEDDDDLFLPPTQALEYLHKENKTSGRLENLSDQNSNSAEVEDQLEMLFYSQSDDRFAATQQLVDVLEDKNEDVVEDSMIEQSDGRLKNAEFSSNDSIRMILDDFADEDEKANKEEIDKTNSDEKEKQDDPIKKRNRKEAEVSGGKEKNNNSSRGKKNGKGDVSDNGESQNSNDAKSECVISDNKLKDDNKRTKKKNDGGEDEFLEKKEVGRRKSTRKQQEVCDKQNEMEKKKRFKNEKEITKAVTKVSTSDVNKASETTDSRKGFRTDQVEAVSSRTRRKNESQLLEDSEQTDEKERASHDKVITRKKNLRAPKSDVTNENRSESESEKGKTAKTETKKEKNVISDDSEDSNKESKSRDRVSTRNRSFQKNVDATDDLLVHKKKKSEVSKETDDVVQLRSRKDSTNKTEKKEENKAAVVRSSTRNRKTIDESTNTKKVTQEANSTQQNKDSEEETRRPSETKARIKQKKESDVASDASEEVTHAKSATRKRGLKTTDSGDEFEPKIAKTTSSTPVAPVLRKSGRIRKINEISSAEIISASSTLSQESAKRTRRLSANSRALRNEKNKYEEVKGSTPKRTKRQLKPKVVFTMMDEKKTSKLESLIRQLGGSVVDTVDACTVLVTESVKRSPKLLCAVGLAKPICSPQWLDACKKTSSFLDPWDYILVDAEAEEKWQFSLRDSLTRSDKSKLLENYTFQIMVNTAADVLKEAIESSGGKCVTKNLAKANTDNILIVSSNEYKSKYSRIVKQNPEIKVVEAEAVFDGILRQEFMFNKYLLL